MKRYFSLCLLLSVVFLNFMGLGLVFPLFGTLFFDRNILLVPAETSELMRGFWMGLLIGLSPLVQFFGSPLFGSLSDQRGRKPFLIYGLSIGVLAYLVGAIAMKMNSLWLLILYRALFGVTLSIVPVVQAALIDRSTPQNKGQYLSLYSMSLAVGFCSGPFLGGILAQARWSPWFDHSTLFLVGGLLTILNLTLLCIGFKETHCPVERKKIELWRGIKQIKAAWRNDQLRSAFIAFFFFFYGWDFFLEFASVALRALFGYTTSQVGSFYSYNSLTYSIATGLLIRPFLRRYEPGKMLKFSMLCGPVLLCCLPTLPDPVYLWGYIPILTFVMALYYPVAMSYVSDHAEKDAQGEMLGIYQSVMALALLLGPIVMGPFVGIAPMLPIYLGSALMATGGLIFTYHRWSKAKKAQRVNESV